MDSPTKQQTQADKRTIKRLVMVVLILVGVMTTLIIAAILIA
jgi:hypothetical protein